MTSPDGMNKNENLKPGQLGFKFSEESKAKMRAAKLGKKQSPEHIEARTTKLRGRKRSPEAIEATRRARVGIKLSTETRVKMKAAQKEIHERPEWRERQRAAQKKRWEGHVRFFRGYRYVFVPEDDPMRCMATKSRKGYVPEHRLVIARHLGRPLDPREHVHHINFDRGDNRIENLELMTPSTHMALHNSLRAEAWNLLMGD